MFTKVNIERLVMSNITKELGSEQNISETINEFPNLPVTVFFLFLIYLAFIFIAFIMALDDIPDDENNNHYPMEEVIIETNPTTQSEAVHGPGPGPGRILSTTTPPPPPPQPPTQSMIP